MVRMVTPKAAGITFGINGRYFAEALALSDEERVTLSLEDALKPIRFDSDRGALGVVMPMRL